MPVEMTTDDAMQDLVRTEVIAAGWDLDRRTLENWRSRGVGPPFVKINGAVRYSRRACAEWLAAQNAGPAAAPPARSQHQLPQSKRSCPRPQREQGSSSAPRVPEKSGSGAR